MRYSLSAIFALCLLCLCLSPREAHAKAFKLGDDEGVAWISIPDQWEPKTIEDGVEGTSPDKETYVAAEIVDAAELEDAVKEELQFFDKQKIKLKEATKTEKKTEFSGLPAYDVAWEATDEDGPTHVSATFIKLDGKKVMMVTYWGTPAGEKSNIKELQEISQSVKPIKSE